MRYLTALLFSALLLAACGESDPAPVDEARWEETDCPMELPTELAVSCGTLEVPEVHGQTAGRRVRLPVAIVRSQDDEPSPVPLVYLEGGPGGDALADVAGLARWMSPILAHRDLIILQQRGTASTTPSLDCPEIDEPWQEAQARGLSRDEERARLEEALGRCHARLAADHDPSAYHSAAIAADLELLRQALGIEKWYLYGISYGTRVALTAMRDSPEGIQGVILDSPVPLQADLRVAWGPNAMAALERLYTACEADAVCSRNFPALPAVLDETVARLDADPLELQLIPEEGDPWTMVLDGRRLIEAVFGSLYRADRIPYIPRMIYEVRNGNTLRLANWIEEGYAPGRVGSGAGMRVAVLCREEIPFSALESSSPDTETRSRLEEVLAWGAERRELCATWGTEPAPAIENEPVTSEIPTLILTGHFDPVTPPAWGDLIAEDLGRTYHYEFPGTGHSVLVSRECAMDLAVDFLNVPIAAPDAGCMARQRTFFLVQ